MRDRKQIAKEALDAIRYVSMHGSDADNDVMNELILCTPEARLRISQTVRTNGWTQQQFEDACLEILISLEKEIRQRRN